jgi:hypothetical protein
MAKAGMPYGNDMAIMGASSTVIKKRNPNLSMGVFVNSSIVPFDLFHTNLSIRFNTASKKSRAKVKKSLSAQIKNVRRLPKKMSARVGGLSTNPQPQ